MELKPPGSAVADKTRQSTTAKTRDISADVALKKGKEEIKSNGLPNISKVQAGRDSSQEGNPVSNPSLETDRSKPGITAGKGQ